MKLNLYMIDDDPEKVKHLKSFAGWVEEKLKCRVALPWEDPATAAKDPEKVKAALCDEDGMLLLDLWMPQSDYHPVIKGLRIHFPECVAVMNDIYDSFDKQEEYALAAWVLAVGRTRKSRILICTTASMTPGEQRKRYRGMGIDIPWPEDHEEFQWDENVLGIVRKVVQPFRMKYIESRQEWQRLVGRVAYGTDWGDGSGRPGLFPTNAGTSLTHNAYELLQNTQRLSSCKAEINTCIEAFFKTFGSQVTLDMKQSVYLLKGASHGVLHLGSVLLLVMSAEIPVSNFGEVGLNSLDPGATMQALLAIKGSGDGTFPPVFNVDVSEDECGRITTVMKITMFCREGAAEEVAETCKLSPEARMASEPSRIDPGTVVLALDYLQPSVIDCDGSNVIITKTWQDCGRIL